MVAIDMSAAKAPPRKATSTARRTPTPTPVPTAAESATLAQQRAEGLMGLAQLASGVCLLTGQYADAATIATRFPPVATEVGKLAGQYDQLAKPIDFLIQIGPFGALIAAGLPFVLQIAANHGVVNAAAMAGQGVVPPELLAEQMKADIARMQANSLREQREAMAEAQQARAALDAEIAFLNQADVEAQQYDAATVAG